MDLAGAAAAARDLAARAGASLAKDCARAAAREYLAALHVTTPVETGALRASERVWRVWGDGEAAEAIVGPNIIYARFRNDGGTIHVRRKKVLSNGSQFFGKQVTQAGSHYMERAEGDAEGPITATCNATLGELLDSSGLG